MNETGREQIRRLVADFGSRVDSLDRVIDAVASEIDAIAKQVWSRPAGHRQRETPSGSFDQGCPGGCGRHRRRSENVPALPSVQRDLG